MVQNGVRFCDVCEEEIPKGERYAYYVVASKERQVRIDVRLDCRMNIHGRDAQAAVN